MCWRKKRSDTVTASSGGGAGEARLVEVVEGLGQRVAATESALSDLSAKIGRFIELAELNYR